MKYLNTILSMECREYLKSLPDNSINCAITSIPYYGLRIYDGPQTQIWGETTPCDHNFSQESAPPAIKNATQGSTETIKHPSLAKNQQSLKPPTKLARITDKERELGQIDPKNPGPWLQTPRPNMSGGASEKQTTHPGSFNVDYQDRNTWSAYCNKCNAWQGQFGLEPTLSQFVLNCVEIFRELRRVLHLTGTLWLNVGDSYCGSGGAGGDYAQDGLKEGQPKYGPRPPQDTMKAKDLMLVPAAVAMGLRADGWFLRDEIIWKKDSVMPSSVQDRTTRQTETIWLLTMSSRYFFDNEAIKEKATSPAGTKGGSGSDQRGSAPGVNGMPPGAFEYTGTRNARNVWVMPVDEEIDDWSRMWTMNPKPGNWEYCSNCDELWTGKERQEITSRILAGEGEDQGKPKMRTVKKCPNCNTDEHLASHYAAFPPALPERCIKAGTSEFGACAGCNTPYQRILKKRFRNEVERDQDTQTDFKDGGASHKPGNMNSGDYPTGKVTETVGWGAWHDHENDLTKGQRGGDGSNKAAEGWKEMQDKGAYTETVGWEPPIRSDQKALKEKQTRMGAIGLGAGHGDIYPQSSVYAEPKDTVGHEPTCSCGSSDVIPCTVLDMFMGSGSTAIAAQKLGRNWAGCDLSPLYTRVANARVARAKDPHNPLSNPKIKSQGLDW